VAKKLLGVLFLIAGIVVALFGILYMNAPQYKMKSMMGYSDSTGTTAIIIGVIGIILGAGLLITSNSSKQK
jgi:predicted transporter